MKRQSHKLTKSLPATAKCSGQAGFYGTLFSYPNHTNTQSMEMKQHKTFINRTNAQKKKQKTYLFIIIQHIYHKDIKFKLSGTS